MTPDLERTVQELAARGLSDAELMRAALPPMGRAADGTEPDYESAWRRRLRMFKEALCSDPDIVAARRGKPPPWVSLAVIIAGILFVEGDDVEQIAAAGLLIAGMGLDRLCGPVPPE
jgi:hypothetical protein